MKRILRGLMWLDPQEKQGATENYKAVRGDRLRNLRKAEEETLNFLTGFFTKYGEAPQQATVLKHFEGLSASEEVVLLEEVAEETLVTSSSFTDEFEKEVEDQAAAALTNVMRTAQKIATTGEKVKGNTIKGTDAAVAYLFSEAKSTPKNTTGRMPASMKASGQSLLDLYAQRKANPAKTYGILTHYGIVDAATAGIRKKQLYIIAGFGGHLKTTWALNHMLNAVVEGGWNISYYSSEMPAEELKMMMVAMHSANPIFHGVGRPLPSFRYLLGALDQNEEKFMKEVQDDLINNSNYGNFKIYDPADFTTLGSIFQMITQDNMEEEVDGTWVDYVTRLPLDVKYRGMSITEARNEQLTDSKRFSLEFNGGAGIAFCTPLQINRTGYLKAKTQGGLLDKTHLAEYNRAEREADVISYIWYDLEEQATSEPKVGMMKSRWGKADAQPVPVYIEPDSRRIMDLSAGMGPATGYTPTGANQPAEEEVVL